MSFASTLPSHCLRLMGFCLRWTLRLLLVFWALVLIGVAILHWAIMPRLPQWQPEIEAFASRELGNKVQFARIESLSNGLIPAVRIHGLAVQDANGQEVLSVPEITLAVSLRSLWRRGLEQLVVDQAHIRVVREPSRWLVAGQAIEPGGRSDNAQIARAIDWFLAQPELLLQEAQVTVHDATGAAPDLRINAVNVLLRSHGKNHEFMLGFAPDLQDTEPFEWRAKLRRPLLSFSDSLLPLWSGQTWLQWGHVNLTALAPYLPWLDSDRLAGLQGQAGLRAWMQLRNGQPSQVTVDLALADAHAQWRGAQLPFAMEHLNARLQAQRFAGGWELSSQGLNFETGSGLKWTQGDWSVRHEEGIGEASAQTSLSASHADLGALAQLLKFIPWQRVAPAGAADAVASAQSAPQSQPSPPNQTAAAEWDVGELIARWQPSGEVENLQLKLSGPLDDLAQLHGYSFKAMLHNVSFGMGREWVDGRQVPRTLVGIEGLSGTVDLTQHEGHAEIHMDQGKVRLPKEFEQDIALASLHAKANWHIAQDGQIQLSLDEVEAANADAQGHARVHWRTYTDAEMALYKDDPKWAGKRWPGVLDLEAKLTRADGSQTYKYLPLAIPAEAREYVKEAILQASSDNVAFLVKGDLHRFPFASQAQVEQAKNLGVQEQFRITASVTDANYRYLPHFLLHKSSPAWPDLMGAQAELLFEGHSMTVTVAKSNLGGDARLQVQPGSRAYIADFNDTVIEVQAKAQGPLQNQLAMLKNTPAAAYSGHVLDAMKASGNASFALDLSIPVHHTLEGLKVKGEVNLNGNNLQWWPQLPELGNVRGTVHFTDAHFWFEAIKVQMLGGESVVSARMQEMQRDKAVQVQVNASGRITAQGLQSYAPSEMAKQLTAHLTGATSYTAQVNTVDERVFVDIQSDLQGLASNLPAPLRKEAQADWPLRIQSQAQGDNDALRLQLGEVLQASYLIKPARGDQPGQSTGQIWIGDFQAQDKSQSPVNADFSSQKTNSVWAFIRLADLDAQAWYEAILASPALSAAAPQSLSGAQTAAALPARAAATPTETSPAPALDAFSAQSLLYWPSTSRWEVQKVQWAGRTINHVRLQLRHENPERTQWAATIRAQEVVGDIDYFPPAAPEAKGNAAGLLKARLGYLELPSDDDASASVAPAALREPPAQSAAAMDAAGVKNLPALDLDIERLLLAQRDWGHVRLRAVNLGAVAADPQHSSAAHASPNETEWRINHLSIEVPEAQLSATGSWKVPQTGYPLALLRATKRTALDFKLEVNDASRLLARLGMPGILRAGSGSIEGSLGWVGPPVKLDYPSLTGQFKLRIDKGQLLKADAGVGRLLGVLSLQALPRRLTLDFRDVFSEGFAFDFVQGDFEVNHGVIETNNLQMKGINAAVIIEGSANVVNETQDIRALVVPEINTMTAALVATAINPAVGAGAFLAQLFLGKPLSQAATREFHVHGSWSDPQVDRVSE